MATLINKAYLFYAKRKLKQRNVIIRKGCKFSATDFFEGNNSIGGKVVESYIGYGTYISDDCFISHCKIGKFCSIAPKVTIIRGEHPTADFVSTSPSFYLKDVPTKKSYVDKNSFDPYHRKAENSDYEVVIGNDVWIGQNAFVRAGVTIGDGAIIGANALVMSDVAPYAIVAGVPAKLIRYRFSEEQIQQLLEVKWWDKEDEWLQKHAEDFKEIEGFLKRAKGL